MSKIKSHGDRSRGPAARQASRERRAERAARERMASAAERAYLALIERGDK